MNKMNLCSFSNTLFIDTLSQSAHMVNLLFQFFVLCEINVAFDCLSDSVSVRVKQCRQESEEIVLRSGILIGAQTDNHQPEQIVICSLRFYPSRVLVIHHFIIRDRKALLLRDVVPANPDAATRLQRVIIALSGYQTELDAQGTRKIINPSLLDRISRAVVLLRFDVDVEIHRHPSAGQLRIFCPEERVEQGRPLIDIAEFCQLSADDRVRSSAEYLRALDGIGFYEIHDFPGGVVLIFFDRVFEDHCQYLLMTEQFFARPVKMFHRLCDLQGAERFHASFYNV